MKNTFSTKILFLISAVFLSSCASLKPENHLNKVYVTNSTQVDLLLPEVLGEKSEYQYFEGNFGNNTFSALLYLETTFDQTQILLLNEMGLTLGSIFYDGKTCLLESELFPKKLKGEYIILDLQNAYAPAEVLKNHYAKYKLSFEETKNHDSFYRTIKKNDGSTEVLIEEIFIDGTKTQIKNHLRNYTYTLLLNQ